MATIVSEKETHEQEIEAKADSVNIPQFLGEVKTEFLKITWPSKDQVTREFISVVLLVAILTSIIFIIDKAFGVIANFFTGRLY